MGWIVFGGFLLLSPWIRGTLYEAESILLIGLGAGLIAYGAVQLSKKNRAGDE